MKKCEYNHKYGDVECGDCAEYAACRSTVLREACCGSRVGMACSSQLLPYCDGCDRLDAGVIGQRVVEQSSVGHTPGGKWEFDESVTNCFSDMLHRSIPEYDTLRQTCFNVGARYVKPNTVIVDLGCSDGIALQPFVDKFGAYNRYTGVDVSEPMLEKARYRYRGYTEGGAGIMEIRNCDLRNDYPAVSASLTLCVLTLQFTPTEYRQQILRRIFNHTVSGGALILVEKVLGASAEIDDVLVSEYYAMKKRNGYSQDDIDRKKLSLEGVLVPITAAWNEDLLDKAGFHQVDCFWRNLNFVGWIAIK